MNIEDLKQKQLILFECISGSKAYGLSTPQSDTDIRGVFVMPQSTLYGLHAPDQVSDATQDTVYYELRRFVELLSKNNPNVLELLNIPSECILYKHPLYEKFHQVSILSKLCRHTFAGYAMTQVKKARGLNKKILNPVDKTRKNILDFCYVTHNQGSLPVQTWLKIRGFSQDRCGLVNIPHIKNLYALFYDAKMTWGYQGIMRSENAQDVALSSVPEEETAISYLYFNQEGYASYCKDYREYWEWVAQRNEVRYENTLTHGKNYDAKNMMHTFRLLEMANEIALRGQIIVQRPDKEFLFKIREGHYEYEELVHMAETSIEQLEKAYSESQLPENPDVEGLERVLVEIRQAFYAEKQ
ncbi:MAG: nucleotidyltransferase domain-containing protein [Microscillaceae bacterium]|nr:nucleotidyltransferase domain-containing protein [Microscillaceae bacterium]